jgi:hypothetical protein
MRSSRREAGATLLVVRRRCLVCDAVQEVTEPAHVEPIGTECVHCHAPTERIEILTERKAEPNPHAAALARLGGLKGGPARASALSARRRREIARAAARARWNKE